MSADNASNSKGATPRPEEGYVNMGYGHEEDPEALDPETLDPESEEESPDRRRRSIWATLAMVLLTAIVLLLLLTYCVPRVPDVIGLTERQATVELKDAGYKVGTVSHVGLPNTPAGKVGEQAPGAWTIFPRGGSVDLIVALGAEWVVVPDVVGHDTPSAELLITGAHLEMDATGVYDPTIPPGAVISQDPVGGTKVRRGSKVRVVVSLGIEPDLSGYGGFTPGGPASDTAGSGSTGSGSSPWECNTAYPGASVWASGGDIYIRLSPGGGTRQLTSGAPWDSNPLLAPSAKYVVFMRGSSSGSKVTDIGRVCLTNFKAEIMKMPWSSQMTAGHVWYQDYLFGPSSTGTAAGSDWLVISQLYEYPLTSAPWPDPTQNVRGRLAVCNVPLASSWVGWNEAFFPTASIDLSRSGRAGCVKVSAVNPEGVRFVRDFNVYTGMFLR